jgi:hypothetical protein
MLYASLPYKFSVPWGASATTGYITSPVPASSAGANASQALGFPPITAAPVGAGGVPPNVADFNGLGNYITAWLQWLQAGGPVQYDAAFSAAIGGYPLGALLKAASGTSYWQSTVDGNVTDPDTGGAGWITFPLAPNTYPVGANYSTTASVSSISVTSGAMTAPCNGYAMIQGAISVSPLADVLTTTNLTASLAGLVPLCYNDNGGLDQTWAYLPMTAGQSSTFSMAGTQSGSSAMAASVVATFVPMG